MKCKCGIKLIGKFKKLGLCASCAKTRSASFKKTDFFSKSEPEVREFTPVMHSPESIKERGLEVMEIVDDPNQSAMQRVGNEHGIEVWSQRHWIIGLRMSENEYAICRRPDPVNVPTPGCKCYFCTIEPGGRCDCSGCDTCGSHCIPGCDSGFGVSCNVA